MAPERIDIAAEVRAVVARKRLRQHEIAAALGLTQAAVSRRLSGTIPLTGRELQLLAKLLDVPVGVFFGEPAAVPA